MPLDVLFVMKTLEDEWYGVITAYKFAVLEILRNFFVLAYTYCVSAPSLHIESTDSMIHAKPTSMVEFNVDAMTSSA